MMVIKILMMLILLLLSLLLLRHIGTNVCRTTQQTARALLPSTMLYVNDPWPFHHSIVSSLSVQVVSVDRIKYVTDLFTEVLYCNL